MAKGEYLHLISNLKPRIFLKKCPILLMHKIGNKNMMFFEAMLCVLKQYFLSLLDVPSSGAKREEQRPTFTQQSVR